MIGFDQSLSPSTSSREMEESSLNSLSTPPIPSKRPFRRRIFKERTRLPRWPTLTAMVLLLISTSTPSLGQEDPSLMDQNPFLTEPDPNPLFIRESSTDKPMIHCTIAEPFRNQSRFERFWTKVVGVSPTTIAKNHFIPKTLQRDYEIEGAGSEYNLRLKSVSLAKDNGNFFCKLYDTQTGHERLSRPAEVVVVVPPQPPVISEQPESFVRENDFISIKCESTTGNPSPKFTWIFDNKTKVPESWSHERVESGTSKAVSTIQWHVKSEDNGGYLTCQVWNQAMNESDESKSADTNRLNVHYAPRVQVGPLPEVNVEEGESIELNCRADANPPAKLIQWHHPASGRHFPEPQWRMEPVEKRFAGEYHCQAHNSMGTTNGKLQMNVLHGPKVRVKVVGAEVGTAETGTLSPAEGDRLVLNCEVEANPPIEQISWTGSNGFKHNGSQLIIHSVNRAHVGNFSCSATNTLTSLYTLQQPSFSQQQPSNTSPIRVGSASVFIDVKRRPGKAHAVASRETVDVGQRLQVSCSMGDEDPGNPPAKFKWVTPTSRSDEPAFLPNELIVVNEAKLEDNGKYKCIPYNDIGQGEPAIIKVTVVQPAKLARTLPPHQLFIAGDQDRSLLCDAHGYPAPSVQWFKDGVPIAMDGRHWQIRNREPVSKCEKNEICALSVISTLHFVETVRWSDKGNYSCMASNLAIMKKPEWSQIQITVTHEPVVLNQKFSDYALAAANVGTTARIYCLVSARPEPNFTWLRNGVVITPNAGTPFAIQNSRIFERLDEFESVLEMKEISEREYGSYVCQAKNGGGTNKMGSVEFRLQAKSRPQTPFSTRLLEASSTWLQVGWKPGFDGGEQQIFELEYRVVDPYTGQQSEEEEPTIFTFHTSNSTSLLYYGQEPSVRIGRASDSQSDEGETFLVHNLTRLKPMSALWYRVRAKNSLGVSDWTAIASVVTLDAKESVGVDERLQAPESMMYFPDEHKLIVQPQKMPSRIQHPDSIPMPPICTLVYVLSEDEGQTEGVWRSIDCFSLSKTISTDDNTLQHHLSSGTAQTIQQVKPAEGFRIRYCYKNDLSVCSPAIEIYVDAASMSHWSNSSWKMILAVLAGITSITLVLLIILLFCRNRFGSSSSTTSSSNSNGALMKQRRKNRKVPKRLNLNGGVVVDRIDVGHPQLPHSETKNTVVHGSQTDSGVFTLGSTNAAGLPNGNPANGAQTAPANEHSWPSNHSSDEDQPYDFSTDPYLQELSSQLANERIMAIENGYPQPEDQQPHLRHFNPQMMGTMNSNHNYAHFFNTPSANPPQRSPSASSSHNPNHIVVHHPQDHQDGSETGSYSGQPRVMREIIV